MENTNNPTLCYSCKYRGTIPGDCHSQCNNPYANVTGDRHGIECGWFFHPYNFDPIWLLTCNGYDNKGK